MSLPNVPPASPPVVSHEAEVKVVLDQRVRWLSQNQDVTGHTLSEQVHRMWRDWRPVVDGLLAFVVDGHPAYAWVFEHPEHGWAATYLADADRLWEANQQRAVLMAHQFSASAPTLLGVCERMLGSGASPSRAQMVTWLLDCTEVEPETDRDALRTLLALRVPLTQSSHAQPGARA